MDRPDRAAWFALVVLLAGAAAFWLSRPVAPASAGNDGGIEVRPGVTGAAPVLPAAIAAVPAGVPARTASPSATEIVLPPALAALPGAAFDPFEPQRALYRHIWQQARDEPWAGTAEAALLERLRAIKDVGDAAHPVRARCATDWCTMDGLIRPGASIDEVNAAMQAIQSPAMNEGMARHDVVVESASFGGDAKAGASAFVLFLKRRRP